jgi:hypothetical protein
VNDSLAASNLPCPQIRQTIVQSDLSLPQYAPAGLVSALTRIVLDVLIFAFRRQRLVESTWYTVLGVGARSWASRNGPRASRPDPVVSIGLTAAGEKAATAPIDLQS